MGQFAQTRMSRWGSSCCHIGADEFVDVADTVHAGALLIARRVRAGADGPVSDAMAGANGANGCLDIGNRSATLTRSGYHS